MIKFLVIFLLCIVSFFVGWAITLSGVLFAVAVRDGPSIYSWSIVTVVVMLGLYVSFGIPKKLIFG